MSEGDFEGETGEEVGTQRHTKGGRKVRVPDVELLAERLADVRKVRKGHVRKDAPIAPIDGDYDPLRLTNEKLDTDYFWASDRDRGRLGGRGWVEEQWGPDCARPAFYFGNQTRGAVIRFNELTLMKLPKDVAARLKANDPKRRQHAQLMREILSPTLPNHITSLTEQTLTGPTRS